MHNNVEALRLMRKHGADVTAPLRCGTMLVAATTPPPPNCIPPNCKPPPPPTCSGVHHPGPIVHVFHLAVVYAASAAVRFLVEEAGLPFDDAMQFPHASGGFWNIAHTACKYAGTETLLWVLQLEHGVSLLGQADPDGKLPLHHCLEKGDPFALSAVLANTTLGQLEQGDKQGKTALMQAQKRVGHEQSAYHAQRGLDPGKAQREVGLKTVALLQAAVDRLAASG